MCCSPPTPLPAELHDLPPTGSELAAGLGSAPRPSLGPVRLPQGWAPSESGDPVVIGIGVPDPHSSKSRIRPQGSPVPAQTLGGGQARAGTLRFTPEQTPAQPPSHSPKPAVPWTWPHKHAPHFAASTARGVGRPARPSWPISWAAVCPAPSRWESVPPAPRAFMAHPVRGHGLGRKRRQPGPCEPTHGSQLSSPGGWPVTGELAHTCPPSPAQAAGGGPWRDGQEEGQKGRAGAPALSTTAGGAAPGPLGGAGWRGASCRGCRLLFACGSLAQWACGDPPDKGGPHAGARTPFLGSVSQPGAPAP